MTRLPAHTGGRPIGCPSWTAGYGGTSEADVGTDFRPVDPVEKVSGWVEHLDTVQARAWPGRSRFQSISGGHEESDDSDAATGIGNTTFSFRRRLADNFD